MSFYRIQDADRPTTELLDPTHQWSSSWSGSGDPRRGVSVCQSQRSLIGYFARRAADGIGYDADFLATLAVVELTGEPSDEPDDDAAEGAELIIPTQIIGVRPLTADEISEILADAPTDS